MNGSEGVNRSDAQIAAWVYRLLCRVLGHRWQAIYRESDGYPLCSCYRCGLTERWAGGMLVESNNWRESERLNGIEERHANAA